MIRIQKITRSKRKTYSLEVTRQGELHVRVPWFMTDWQVEQIVLQKADWILQKMELVRRHQVIAPMHTFADGEMFPFLGEQYPLKILSEQKLSFCLSDHKFILDSRYTSTASKVFESWYRKQARSYFSTRLSELAQKLNVHPKILRISSARTRWGSCSTRGTISLSWRLIMAPPAIIDYVIIHELIHLKHPNHSPQFWAAVEVQYPDHKTAKHWLKSNGQKLTLAD